jgi:hypothetical protein
MLAKHGVAHVYNHWSYMPPLAEQHNRMGSLTAPFTVLRLLTPLKMSYETAKKRADPYTTIVQELPEMRPETVELVRKALAENRHAYVLVNNRTGSARPVGRLLPYPWQFHKHTDVPQRYHPCLGPSFFRQTFQWVTKCANWPLTTVTRQRRLNRSGPFAV